MDTTVHTYTYSYRIKKEFHSGERFQKFPDTAGKYDGYVWTQAHVFVKKKLRFHKFPDTCGRFLSNDKFAKPGYADE